MQVGLHIISLLWYFLRGLSRVLAELKNFHDLHIIIQSIVLPTVSFPTD